MVIMDMKAKKSTVIFTSKKKAEEFLNQPIHETTDGGYAIGGDNRMKLAPRKSQGKSPKVIYQRDLQISC